MKKTLIRTLIVFVLSAAMLSLFAQPQPPTNLTATVVGTGTTMFKVSLAWQAADPTVTGLKYNVYKKNGGLNDTGAFKKIASLLSSKAYTDGNVQVNKKYSYYVTAVSGQNESQPSNKVEAKVVAPVKATVTGVVSKDVAGTPIAHAYLEFFQNSSMNGAYAYTDSLGNYKVKLQPGAYYLYISANGYVSEYYDNVSSFQQATAITLVSADSLNVNVGLAPVTPPPAPYELAAVVGGTTTMPSVGLTWKFDTTVTGASFNVYRKEDTAAYKKIAYMVSGKSYTDRTARVGKTYTYKVTAVKNQLESGASNEVSVTVAAPPPVVKGVITGVITNEATNAPVNRATVKFFTSTTNSCVTGMTDSLGQYKVRLAPGVYKEYTAAQGYVPEYWDNVATVSLATEITVAANDSLNMNIALAAVVPPVINTVSGSVKDSLGNVVPAMVRLYSLRLNSHHYFVKEVRTDSLGNFSIPAKQGDTCVAYAYPKNRWDWYAEYYNNKRSFNEADRIAVTANVTGIDFVLEHKPVYPNGISGVVKDTLNNGVEAMVTAFPRKMTSATPRRTYTTHTDTLGNYSFTNMFPGQYILLASPRHGFKPTYFKYNGTTTMNWRHADSVVVDSAALVQNINFRVLPIPDSGFGTIHGRVLTADGSPVIGAYVYAVNSREEVYTFAITDARGQYTISGLIPDIYSVISDKQDFTSSARVAEVDYLTKAAGEMDFTLTPNGVTDVQSEPQVVANYTLSQNYPNPFNPSTVISYAIPTDAKVTLKVYSVLGNEVATLVNGFQSAGAYNVTFNASSLPSGVYLYKLESGNFSAVKKLILMK